MVACSVWLVAACGGATPSDNGPASDACAVQAREFDGTVAASVVDEVADIRGLSALMVGGQLDRFADDQSVTICWIDGTIPKGPAPNADGSIPPSYDRAVIAIVDDEVIPIALGYREDLPVP